MVRYFGAQHAGDRLHNEKNREENKKLPTLSWIAPASMKPGKVQSGQKYFIVYEAISSGGAISELRHDMKEVG